MMKNIFSNLSRGIFYTIGRIIAYFLVGILLYYILQKIDLSTILMIGGVSRGTLL